MSTESAETQESPASKLEENIQNIETVEEKLKFALQQMKAALAEGKNLSFKLFWEARYLCLKLFKENMPPALRAKLWNDFVDYSKEAKSLKAILDEQASFAIEQIELAIGGLQKDLERYEDFLKQSEEASLPFQSSFLEKRQKYYFPLQQELNLLNTFASRVHGLRKEVLKTEMRIKFKSKFFKQLSLVGDLIFPKRKELIHEISTKFVADIELFAKAYFSADATAKAPFYFLKDEIKKLQSASKLFTLNTKAFNQARLKLSECWDKLKLLEQQYKEEMEQKKEVFEENKKRVQEKIQLLSEKCLQDPMPSPAQIEKDTDELFKFMRTVELSSRDVKFLKDLIWQAKKPLLEKEKKEEAKTKKIEEEKTQARLEQINSLKEEIEKLSEEGKKKTSMELAEDLKVFYQKIKDSQLSKAEKQMLEKQLKPLKELVNDKKDEALLSLSQTELDSLSQLKTALKQSQSRRKEIKEQLEVLRRAGGCSDLDFEKAMNCKEQMDKEKTRLENIDSVIEEINEKIFNLEGN